MSPHLFYLRTLGSLLVVHIGIQAAFSKEWHVSTNGNERWDGSFERPFKTIMAAAEKAQPGDVITVHEGTYRERVTPPRGGESNVRRITYQAAVGENVIIKGSEIVRDWKPLSNGVWRVAISNSFFGNYNPYKDLIAGDWFTDKGRPHHTGEVYLNGKSLWEMPLLRWVITPEPVPDAIDREGSTWTWFCESDSQFTYIFANFHNRNPNEELVEINVRDSCFYPAQPGCHFITIRGFRMCQAATQWAAPTAEQIGLIGTHWSKGWIIENNVISDSKCSGITLGKDRKTGHNVWTKDPSKDGAVHYNEVVVRALRSGWSREKIGSHIVRNNTIFNCEQTGICGSLGAVFSQITSNHIYNIWAKRQFTGAEMAGIKLHAAIDVVIENNRIHHAGRGMWLDWMAQGTRVTRNLCYENSTDDLFVEVDHGPFVVDNNLFLSAVSLSDMSEGGAYAHNLFGGRIITWPEPNRSTPFHRAHSTEVAGLSNIKGGDDRFYNNILVGKGQTLRNGTAKQKPTGFGLAMYDTCALPVSVGGNIYVNGAEPSTNETSPALAIGPDPNLRLREDGDTVYWYFDAGLPLTNGTKFVTSELLGKARIPNLAYENREGSPLVIDRDYFGNKRNPTHPAAGPFEHPNIERVALRIW